MEAQARIVPIESVSETSESRYEIWIANRVSQQVVYQTLRALKDVLDDGGNLLLVEVHDPARIPELQQGIANLIRQTGSQASVVDGQRPETQKVVEYSCRGCGNFFQVAGRFGQEDVVGKQLLCCGKPMDVRRQLKAQ